MLEILFAIADVLSPVILASLAVCIAEAIYTARQVAASPYASGYDPMGANPTLIVRK